MDLTAARPPDRADPGTTQRQRTLLLVGLLVVVMTIGWFQWRALGSTRDTYETALRQVAQMQTDAARIQSLRKAPLAAASRTRPNEELLAGVERALAAAGIRHSQWHDSIPQPARRIAKSDYRKLSTRLYFEGITLQQLATLAHHLETNDPTLSVSGLNLTSRDPRAPEYDLDLAISYLVYAP